MQFLRYPYLRGQEKLLPVAIAQANDLGDYRLYGLPPGRLQVYAGNQLTGDPCPGVVKQLAVEYSYEGARRTRVIPEGQSLSLP